MLYWLKRGLALFFDRGESHKTSGFRPPSYIPPERFARALSDMALGDSVDRLRETPGRIEQGLSKDKIEKQLKAYKKQIEDDAKSNEISIRQESCAPADECLSRCASHLSKVLTRLWHQAGGDADRFLKEIETWFEDANDRATGWFKRKLSPKLFAVGVLVAFVLNVDTLQILSRLSDDPQMRQTLVEMAVDQASQPLGGTPGDVATARQEFERAHQQLLSIEPLMGWRLSSLPEPLGRVLADDPPAASNPEPGSDPDPGSAFSANDVVVTVLWLLMKLAGLLITAIALSLGAPFWFDVLRKLVKVRASISEADSEERDRKRIEGDSNADGETHASADAVATLPAVKDDSVRLTTGLVGLAPDATAPDRTNARWMAELAEIAYANQADAAERLEALGLRLDLWLDTRDDAESEFGDIDTQGYIALSRDLIVVAFRGTEPADAGDVLTDLKARMTAIPWFPGTGDKNKTDASSPRAHRGFQAALEAVWSELEGHLKALTTNVPGRRVWFAGHSLGGGLAVLAAARYSVFREDYNQAREAKLMTLMEDVEAGNQDAADTLAASRKDQPGPLPPCGEIHTIGQPAVGDERFAAWLDNRFGEHLVRTVNNRDAVPRLPTPALGYAHAGAELYFDSFGRMKVNPGAWYRGLDALVLDPERVRKQAIEAAGDHAAAAYIELLKGRARLPA